MCPTCRSTQFSIKSGFFPRTTGRRKLIRRYFCKHCHKYWSVQTSHLTRNQKKPQINNLLYRLLCSSVSQRRCAKILGISPTTVQRRILRFQHHAKIAQAREENLSHATVHVAVFDEMESFAHSKCKPLSIAVAVEEGSRRILGAEVAQMPAKGLLAKIARRKYGFRADHRPQALRKVLRKIRTAAKPVFAVKSDESPRYPAEVKKILPKARHQTFKGRRGCVVGQGELKRGGFDPLFSLNHTCAMFRDNLKRLSRRTWCTTKKLEGLQALVDIYVTYHNQLIVGVKNPGLRPLLTAGV